MNPTVVIWILAAVACVLVGREIGKWLFGKERSVDGEEADRRKCWPMKLRTAGLKLLPALLEDFAVGDVNDLLEKIHDTAKLVESGNDAIEKELESTYENVLDKKLATPEGLALVKAKIAVIEAAAAPADALRLRRLRPCARRLLPSRKPLQG